MLSQMNFGKGSSESRRGRCEDDETRSDHLMVEQLIHLVWLNVFQLLHVLIELLHVQALFPQQVVAEECKQEDTQKIKGLVTKIGREIHQLEWRKFTFICLPLD
jgi:hypothetical protein